MDKQGFFHLIFFLFVAAILYLTYRIFEPFAGSIFLAALIAIIFYPVYRRLHGLFPRWQNATAMLSILLVTVMVIIPTIYLLLALGNELITMYQSLEKQVRRGGIEFLLRMRDHPSVAPILEYARQYINVSTLDFESVALDLIRKLSGWAARQSSQIFARFAIFIFNLFITLFTLFFFFRDGPRLINWIRTLLPLTEEQKSFISSRLTVLINATMRAGLIIAFVQGMIGGLTFFFLGLPQPIFWATVMSALSLLPFVGAWLVWIPAGIYLILTSTLLKAVILFGVGMFAIGLVDNFLRPFLIGGSTKLHTMLVFFSALGGLKVFGVMGLALGPIVVVLCITLVNIVQEWSQIQSEEPGTAKDSPSENTP
ncbi:MAG: AI-2E family transporter [Deltaproteobacteria bacterium]|nr:AI-2E family transporter [Deltaproteobacteria bacterium]MBW2306985.1 AI-2E family transporter [Deltaproteobacteria bacterium]